MKIIKLPNTNLRRACPFKKPQIVIKYEVAEVPNPKFAAASNF